MNLRHALTVTVASVAVAAASAVPANAAAASGVDRDTVTVAASAKAPKVVQGYLSDLVEALRVAPERNHNSYTQKKFKRWVDRNGDCQDTRAEVLHSESTRKVTGKCTVKTGRWVSMYDGKVITKASKVDVDHMVPLKEAWVSGGHAWNEDTRTRFANDLGDPRSLRAVSASSNRSKGDRDPAEWLPKRKVCTYVAH